MSDGYFDLNTSEFHFEAPKPKRRRGAWRDYNLITEAIAAAEDHGGFSNSRAADKLRKLEEQAFDIEYTSEDETDFPEIKKVHYASGWDRRRLAEELQPILEAWGY